MRFRKVPPEADASALEGHAKQHKEQSRKKGTYNLLLKTLPLPQGLITNTDGECDNHSLCASTAFFQLSKLISIRSC